MSEPAWVEVEGSSVVSAYRYRQDEHRLDVRLTWGETRSYSAVTKTAFKFFKNAPSIGHHLLQVIHPIRTYDDLGRWK